jgi:hypothetical protein
MVGLADVKEGDKIATPVVGTYWTGLRPTYELHIVTKVTRTQVVTKTKRFRKDTGLQVGDIAFGIRPIAILATPEILEQHEAEVLACKWHQEAVEIINRLGTRIRKNELPDAYIKELRDNFGHLLEEEK